MIKKRVYGNKKREQSTGSAKPDPTDPKARGHKKGVNKTVLFLS